MGSPAVRDGATIRCCRFRLVPITLSERLVIGILRSLYLPTLYTWGVVVMVVSAHTYPGIKTAAQRAPLSLHLVNEC